MRWAKLRWRRLNMPEEGQTLILFVFALAALLGFTALVTDVGLVYVERHNMQNAADAAVLAGAARLAEGAPVAEVIAETQEWVEKNGYIGGEEGVSVSIDVPRTAGAHGGDRVYVEVVIEREVDAFLATAVGIDIWEVAAQAVAGLEAQPNTEYGLIALNEDVSSAVSLDGNASITVSGAGVMVNSKDDEAINLTGRAQLTAEIVDLVGGWRASDTATINPVPRSAGTISDPLANLPVPELADHPIRSGSELMIKEGESAHVEPGIYIGGIGVTGNGQLTMEPGIYFIQGGGLLVSGNSSVNGDGVSIYVTCGSGSCPADGSTGVDISGNANVALSPMTSGAWAGVTFFQDRNNDEEFRISGNGLAGMSGTIYARDAAVELNGNVSASTNAQIIADTVHNFGDASISIEWIDGVHVVAARMRLLQ